MHSPAEQARENESRQPTVVHHPECNPNCDGDSHYLAGDTPDEARRVFIGDAHARAHGERLAPEDRHERISDPTVKTNLPKNLLSALGNTHVNLHCQVLQVKELLDEFGWPDRSGEQLYDFGPDTNLMNALDYARENARLTWVLCGLVSDLRESLGSFVWSVDGELISMGEVDSPLPEVS